jgi:hypothetical protein
MTTVGTTIFSISTVYGQDNQTNTIKLENLFFEVEVLNSWIYQEGSSGKTTQTLGFGPMNAVNVISPTTNLTEYLEFSSTEAYKKPHTSFGTIKKDLDFPLKNIPLSFYVDHRIKSQPSLKVTSKENVTIDGENATKIYADGINNYFGFKFVEYFTLHNGDPYSMIYQDNSPDYKNYFEEFEQMVKSIRFTD